MLYFHKMGAPNYYFRGFIPSRKPIYNHGFSSGLLGLQLLYN